MRSPRGWAPLPFQRDVWKRYLDGESGLLHTPTGSGKTLLGLQFALQIVEALLYGPAAAGHDKPKIGIGADVNRDMRGQPERTPRGPDAMGDHR